VDTVEALAAEHAESLFGAPHAYVQPHSGIDANLVGFWAILAHRLETPALAEGGRAQRQRHVRGGLVDVASRLRRPAHDWHVAGRRRPPDPRLPPNISGKMFHQTSYGTDETPGSSTTPRFAEAGPRVQAADPDGRLLRLPRRIDFAKMREDR
jgi:glycine hydroxymethyltransferase